MSTLYKFGAALAIALIAIVCYCLYERGNGNPNPLLVHHMNNLFTHLDVDYDGYHSLEEWMLWVDNIEKDVSPDRSNLVETLRQSLKALYGPEGIGLTQDEKLARKEFVDKMVKFAEAEGALKRREGSLFFQLCRAWYDVVDATCDGMITLDEYMKLMKARNYNESVAKETFNLMDKKHIGKIERNKLIVMEYDLWFSHEGKPNVVLEIYVQYRRRHRFQKHSEWVHRMFEVFKLVDLEKKDYITIEDWLLWADNIDKIVHPNHGLLEKLRKSIWDFCGEGGIGFIPGKKVTREEFLNLMADFATAQGEKKAKEERLLHQLNHDWYNIVDTSNDDAHVTLEGYKKIMKACNFDESVADDTFTLLDPKNTGKVERSTLIEMEFNFWFTPNDEESEGLFGETFEIYEHAHLP